MVIQDATAHYAVRRVLAFGWPQPSRARCNMERFPSLYRRAITILVDAGLLTDMKRGEHPMWKVGKGQAERWLREWKG